MQYNCSTDDGGEQLNEEFEAIHDSCNSITDMSRQHFTMLVDTKVCHSFSPSEPSKWNLIRLYFTA